MAQALIPNWHDPAVIQDPFPSYALLRRQSPIVWDDTRQLWLVASYDGCQRILKDSRFLSNRSSQFYNQYACEEQKELEELFQGLKSLCIYQDGDLHTAIRRPLVKAFGMRTQASFKQIIDDELDKVFAQLSGRREVDLLKELALELPLAVICRVLNISLEDGREIHRWSEKIARFIDDSMQITAAREALTALRNFQTYLRPLIQKRQGGGGQDLVSVLSSLQHEEHRVTEEDIVGNVILVFMAGHETTTALIANSIHLLWSRSECLRSLREDSSRISAAVDEVLRFESPAQRLGRRVSEDILWDGKHPFKAGQFVMLLLGAANRDEAEFENADTFDMRRAKNRHLALGGGVHYCVGAQLARLEAVTALHKLLELFPNMQLVERNTPYVPSMTLRCRTSVRVHL